VKPKYFVLQASGRDKFTFELKWYIALNDIAVYDEFAAEPKEASPPSIVALKSAACTVRDQILWQERQLDLKVRNPLKNLGE
jgi:active breakpoint cluster region-related protein